MTSESRKNKFLKSLASFLDPTPKRLLIDRIGIVPQLTIIKDSYWKTGVLLIDPNGLSATLRASVQYMRTCKPDMEQGRPFERYQPLQRVISLSAKLERPKIYDNTYSGPGLTGLTIDYTEKFYLENFDPNDLKKNIHPTAHGTESSKLFYPFYPSKIFITKSTPKHIEFLNEFIRMSVSSKSLPLDYQRQYQEFVEEYEKTHGHPISYDYID